MPQTEREADPVVGVIKKMRDEGFTVKHIADCMMRGGFDPSKFAEGIEDYVLRISSHIN